MSARRQTELKSAVMNAPIRQQAPKRTKEEAARWIAEMRERDSEMVAGIFQNKENPGGSVSFSLKIYPGDDFVPYEFLDGERYLIPRGVARHLNNNCYTMEYQHIDDKSGEIGGLRSAIRTQGLNSKTTMAAHKKKHRFAFLPLEFMDDDMDLMPSHDIITSVG